MQEETHVETHLETTVEALDHSSSAAEVEGTDEVDSPHKEHDETAAPVTGGKHIDFTIAVEQNSFST